MKRNLLLKTMLLLCALVVGSGTMWGDEVYKTALFGSSYNSAGVQVYTSTWTATNNGFTVSLTNFNNNNNGWSYVKCGRKNNASTGTITTSSAIDKAITKVALKIDKITAGNVTSIKLYTSSNNSTWTEAGSFDKSTGTKEVTLTTPTANLYYKIEFVCTSASDNGVVQVSQVDYYYSPAPAFSITAQSNNNSYGTVSLSGSVITGSPNTGYRYADPAYSVSPANSATVSQNGDNFTVTPSANTTVTINFEAIPKYIVTFDAEGGSCATSSLTESIGGGGVTLPTATINVAGWEFVGWATSAVSNLSTRPTLYAAGSSYHPTADITLHAVYALEDAINKYAMATSNSDIVDGAQVVISSLGTNKYTLANNNGTLTGITNFTPTDGVITCTNTQAIWTLGISSGNVTIANGGKYLKRSSTTVSADDNSYNWTINESNLVDDRFLVKDASYNFYLEHDGTSWKAYSPNSVTQSNTTNYIGLTIYVEKPNKYESNPSALVTPTVAFTSNAPVTLYLEGSTTNTNTATVTGSINPIKYSSSNTAVATVTTAGVVTPVGVGTATITASVDAELGVSTSASDTYDVTVKSATTLAGIKAVATSTDPTDFTADLASDMVITYISGSHAYLQNGDVAVYASCGNTEGWEVGKKFTGAISGKVRKYYNEYQITAIGQTPVAGGVVPDAIEVAIADLTTENYATYEGRRVVINGATVSTAMANTATSGGQISDGTNTQSINAPVQGVALTKNEKGNFVGYIGRYSNAIRFYMYNQSWFTKTHNAPVNQEMAFATSAYNLDEETAAVTAFDGQTVTETTVKGTLTYSIKEGSNDIITSLNTSTGAVVLNGARGTATIVATAAYAEETDGSGYITPYNAASAEYSVTVRPRYTVTFSVNGTETELREADYNAGITVPANPEAIGEYTFQGWSSTTVATTDTKPTLASLTAGNNYKPSDDEIYYAVFALQTQTGTTDVLDQSYSYSAGNWTVGGSNTDMNTYYMLHNGGYVESEEFDLSIISKVVVYGGYYGGNQYNKLTIGDGTNIWKSVTTSGNSQTGTNTYTDGTALSGKGKLRITSTCGSSGSSPTGVRVSGFEIYKLGPVYGYTRYTTGLSESVDITIPASGYLSYCYENTLDFSSTDVKAYKAKIVEDKVVLTKVDIVPAKTGVVLYCETPDTYNVPVATTDDVVTDNEMIGVLDRTQVVWNPSEGVYNYILQQGEFKKATDGYLKANRAYLSTSYNVSAPGAKALTIVFNDATTGINGVEEIAPVTKTRKVVKNGRLVIETPNGEFTIDGAKVK